MTSGVRDSTPTVEFLPEILFNNYHSTFPPKEAMYSNFPRPGTKPTTLGFRSAHVLPAPPRPVTQLCLYDSVRTS